MDPISAFGVISGAFQVGQIITETLAGLASVRERYQHADLTIGSLERQLMTIRAAITQLEDWTASRNRDCPAEYSSNLDAALDGCRIVVEALSDEVQCLNQGTSPGENGIGVRSRMRIVWREDVIRTHQERLNSQIVALQLLVQVCQCRSAAEQVELLRSTKSRHIIWKVASDVATLRSIRHGSRTNTDSSMSRRASTTDHTVFDFDQTLAASQPYQRIPGRSCPRLDIQSTASHGDQSQTADEGYASGKATSTLVSQTGSLVLPGHPSGMISPTSRQSSSVAFNPTIRKTSPNDVRRSKSDSAYALQPNRSSGSKREKFQSMLRRLSQNSVKPGSSPRASVLGLTDGLPARRRHHDRDINTSIDLKSPDGTSAPLIVKTAQTGTWLDIEKLIERGCDLEARHLQTRRTALLVAAHCGNEAVVEALIQGNARLDAVDKSGSTALHLSASRGHCGVLKLLVSEALDTEARDSRGRTALWVAVERGEIAATHTLLLFKAKVNARAEAQMSALHIAAKQGDEEIVKLLMDGGADLEAKDGTMMTALHYASEKGHIGVMEIFLDSKVNVDVPGCDRRTPLICAAAIGMLEATKLLLKRKASVACVDDAGMTALHWAAYNGHTEVVEILSSKKSSLAKVNSAKRTALHLAAMNSQFAVVELLLRKGIPVEAQCQFGLTALHYACLANNIEISRLLLVSGAYIEAEMEGELYRRPVHIAAARGSMGLLNLLCDKGASLEARDALGYRALGVACRSGHVAAVQNLLDRNVPVHLPSRTGARDDSPLCLAAMSGHLPIVMLLLERGAIVVKQDENGWWPYQYAAYYGHPRVLEVLLSRTLVLLARDELNLGLQLEGIGFAPAADVSEENRREVLGLLHRARQQPEAFIQSAAYGQASSLASDADGVGRGTVSVSPGPMPAHLNSALVTVPETTIRAGPAQELPGTLEQGLPDSRSQTPEHMHGPPSSEPGNLNHSSRGAALQQNLDFATARGGQSSPVRGPQRTSIASRPPLNHPIPRREGVVQPSSFLLDNGDFSAGRAIDTPVSILEPGTRTCAREASPSRAMRRENWEGDLPVPKPASVRDSDSESRASFSTASEGGRDHSILDLVELPA